MKKKFLAFILATPFLIFSTAHADITTYSCMVNKVLLDGKNTKRQVGIAVEVVIDSEWYGKPNTLTMYDGKKIEFILASTQDKVEWFRSDNEKFSVAREGSNGNSLIISASMPKSKPINLKIVSTLKERNQTINDTRFLTCSELKN